MPKIGPVFAGQMVWVLRPSKHHPNGAMNQVPKRISPGKSSYPALALLPQSYGEDRVFVTCYSGYGIKGKTGAIGDLKRHLVCVNRKSGETLWTKTVDAVQPEDPYQGFIGEHGYASGTPVTDGEAVFVFYGKSGVLAYDFDGKELWRADVGTSSSNRRWGSGSSLILFEDFVIVNAAEESTSIRALNKKTGKEEWKADASLLALAYTTPTLAKGTDGEMSLVVPAPEEVWGLNPKTGKLQWYFRTLLTGNISPTAVCKDGIAYIYGGYRGSGSIALKIGGKDDITTTNMLWDSRDSSYVATPLLFKDHLYWVDDRGSAHCVDAKTGKEVYRQRMELAGGGGRPFYASLVTDGKRIYATSRWEGVFVLPAEPRFEILAHNQFADDDSDFNATPALVDGEMFFRSDRYLYCVKGE